MTGIVLGNLDISLTIIQSGQCPNYCFNYNGTLVATDSWKSRFVSYIPGYERSCMTAIAGLFSRCADFWVALNSSTRSWQSLTQEFNYHLKRIDFLSQLILTHANTLEAYPDLQGEIGTALFHLVGDNKSSIRTTLPALIEKLRGQIAPEVLWKIQERNLIPFTEELLKIPAPQTEIWELPPANQDISELPSLYQRIVNPKKPDDWIGWIRYWVIYLWKGHHSKGREALLKMCDTIQRDKSRSPNQKTDSSLALGIAEEYLKRLLEHYKSGKAPLEQVQNSLQELVYAANQCHPEWATQCELQFRTFVQKVESMQDKILQWKATFVHQQLLCFFRSKPFLAARDSHNANMMNILDLHWGSQLGRPGLKAPSADIYATESELQWKEIIEFLKHEWNNGSIVAFLKEKWTQDAVQSFLIYAQEKKWEGEIGLFLTQAVKEKLPTAADEFVLDEYFNNGVLNERGAIRCLLETLRAC